MNIDAIKIATGIECANCSTCCYLGSESDGGEYSTSWPVCRKFPQYENLKSFPFRKEMDCWEPEFWHSKFAQEIKAGEDDEVLAKIDEFITARDNASGENMNHETLKASLPQDLFSADRLPARDENGMVWHPDYDLIYNGLGIDDEGEAAWKFMNDMGLDFAGCEIDEELRDKHEDDDLAACAAWTPEKPDGDGWLLLGIYVGEDGPVAWYVRQGEQA